MYRYRTVSGKQASFTNLELASEPSVIFLTKCRCHQWRKQKFQKDVAWVKSCT